MGFGVDWHIGLRCCLIWLFGLLSFCQAVPLPEAAAENLPAWYGFNLLDKFYKGSMEGPFREEDFRWISELGFNFVRLPMDYRQWIMNNDWTQMDEKILREIDQAVEYGKKYNIHVCINFHRAPGYTVANPPEAKSLWTDAETQRICAMHWATFAKRYKGIPNRNLSFNLLNEPADVNPDTYTKVVEILVKAIRVEDPNRLIIVDGIRWGQQPCQSLKGLHLAQSTRGYEPFKLTHYKANWVPESEGWQVPVWPQPIEISDPNSSQKIDRQWLWEHCVKAWVEMKNQNVGVMVGEWGAYNQTPHEITLRWMEDCLINYRNAGLGWALWNFRGSFGVLDSERKDVQYEDFHGHKLDRKMLDLLTKYK
jgi:endoglucanase